MHQFQTSHAVLSVRFAIAPEVVQTLEGAVLAQTGDAIVTGTEGETWPVTRDAFFHKYDPVAGVAQGDDGLYKKRLAFVQARQLEREETITLSNERGHLTGRIGDWCLSYGLDSQAFIRSDIFASRYEPSKAIAVRVRVDDALLATGLADLIAVETALRAALPHTPIFFAASVDLETGVPLWFHVAGSKSDPGNEGTNAQMVITSAELIALSGDGSSSGQIHRLQNRTALSFTADQFRRMLNSFSSEPGEATEVEILAVQLMAIDELNAALQQSNKNDLFIGCVPQSLASMANDALRRVGAVADSLAMESQIKWQELVLADTKTLAITHDKKGLARPFAMVRLLFGSSIVALGLLAALGLASFSELSEGCDASDWFAWTGCATEGWKHWLGFAAFTLYIGALSLAWWRYAQAKVGRFEGKHQDYRLLAECLRAQYVLSVLDRNRCVADDFPVGKNAESSWVLIAMRTLIAAKSRPHETPEAGSQNIDAAIDWAIEAFVSEQAGYHETTLIKRREHAMGVLSGMGRWGAGLFMVCLVFLTINVLSKLHSHEDAALSPMGQHMLLILQVTGLAIWGSMRKVADTFALEQEVQRGLIILDALNSATAADKKSIIRAALLFARDQADWHALHRSKPIEATTGGG